MFMMKPVSQQKIGCINGIEKRKTRSCGRIRETIGLKYRQAKRLGVKVDIALPCAINELDLASANTLIANGVQLVAEGLTCQLLLKQQMPF